MRPATLECQTAIRLGSNYAGNHGIDGTMEKSLEAVSPAIGRHGLVMHIDKSSITCPSWALHDCMPGGLPVLAQGRAPAMHQLFSRHPLLRAGPNVSVLHNAGVLHYDVAIGKARPFIKQDTRDLCLQCEPQLSRVSGSWKKSS